MKALFTIRYHTNWGERLFIVGSCTELGNNDIDNALEMYYLDADEWGLEVSLPDSIKEITYRYFFEVSNGIRKTEEGDYIHHIVFDQTCGTCLQMNNHLSKKIDDIFDYQNNIYILQDEWGSKPFDNTFYASAFTKNIFARPAKAAPIINCDSQKVFTIRVQAPETKPDQVVALTGNQPCLGNWEPHNAPHLSDENYPLWEIWLDVNDTSFPLEYKFVVLESATNRLCYWEEGENRVLYQLPPKNQQHIQVDDHLIARHSRTDEHLIINASPLRTPKLFWKACGTVVPVFSLRSEQSFGIGDIGDLQKLIDWAKMTNQHVIQVLPMNDTTRTHTWKDSYPYSAISIYALHPLYIHIPMMGELHDIKKKMHYQKIQQQLNEKGNVDYPSVERYKTAYYRDFFEQEKENMLKNEDFQAFIVQNKTWLMPYAAFSYLRDKYQTADFTKWEDDARYNPEKTEALYQADPVTFHAFSYLFFIQYTLHTQFETISRYARANRIILKGDLPIGVNRESVETWTEPDYFYRQVQAGAPPDNFSTKGQNWSFPTYNWNVMKRDKLDWWKKRFQYLHQYFDCIRIDHILGFFRIWEIPIDYTEGLCGYFNPSIPLQKTEIEQYGMIFDERWLTPNVYKKYLPELFGDETTSEYLHYCDSEHLTLNENCSTQRQIEQLFHERNDQKSQIIKDGLMNITNEVLFIKDNHLGGDNATIHEIPNRLLLYPSDGYHPRISAFQSYAYRELSDENKRAFDRLYHDYFFKRHNDLWKQTALSRLQPLLKNTKMLVCGEDLGMLPATVQEVMQSLQLFSLELERLSKDMENEFTGLQNLPYHSLCTTSTHDMNPLRAWWKEDRDKTQRYYNNILRCNGIAPESCSAVLAEQIINNHLHASSMLTIIPLQDWFAMDDIIKRPDAATERINDPSNPNHYWCYRMHITIETLLQSTHFNEKINAMILGSGR